ncbi:Poly [ADP-ribose] polymerase 3 [Paramuricea clavata]|uniref:Poly [ADP-ribose] polymerase 3 n=1 Tax=Paramuricea clavata TaxID=317549 RepID=A0A7D9HKQ6_PARCT|nr:Poly [ADP-ribose] polymerase 3 [Paramuricea clavata]
MDDLHCKLIGKAEVFQGYDCLLNFVDEKSDEFYRIQVLKNDKGCHVWTRWGRNGTDGQSKLEGPISQEEAKKNFEKKFQEKTKNSWDERQQFSPVKGKYSLVIEKTDSSKSSQVTDSQKKTEFPDVLILSEVQLPVDVLYVILSQLPVRDVLRYMQVCKAWKTLLSDKYFWKMYIERHFDLEIKSDLSNEGPMAHWSGPAGWTDNNVNKTWYCYFSEDGEKDDIYVMRPFPSMWNCRVFHPYGLDPFSGDARKLQGFSRSLEILTYMRSEASRLGMQSGE